MTTIQESAGRGRPRSERAEKAIVDATLDMIGEGVTVSELSIEAVASRAGVGKTTIYRRWANKEDLVVDSLATLRLPMPEPGGADVRADLVEYLEVMRSESSELRNRCITNIALNEADRFPDLYRRFRELVIEPRREAFRQVLRRGVATGELRPDLDVEVAMSMLVGAMLFHTKMSGPGYPVPDDLPERLVDEALRGFRYDVTRNVAS
ncbi:TetR/AcrR family transcriptional regulator [Herbidospora daliensis]|uniref:TetR/AcrR family transcriptional regulator n=1 Tax=Herbidospora daliensis TaxID=295585 RepID=UPI000781FA01|nr:TetR/AcrR family transcriptional regulator [Herbidospora daliensis]